MWFLIFIFLKKIHINLSFLGIAINKLKFISSITYNAVIQNHNGINPPICKIIITKNICRITCPTKTILNFFGKTLYYPPIVNSPKGTPQIKRTDIIITIKKVLAPIIAITF